MILNVSVIIGINDILEGFMMGLNYQLPVLNP